MRQLVMEALDFCSSRRRVSALALLVPLTKSVSPASAQDVFGFLRLFSSPIAREPVYQPYESRRPAGLQRRTPRRRPKRWSVPIGLSPDQAQSPWRGDKPCPGVAHSTLPRWRHCHVPGGSKGVQWATRHAARADRFRNRLSSWRHRASSTLARSWQVFVPIWNAAWSTERSTAGGRLAENTRDIETTGGVHRKLPLPKAQLC